MLVAGQSVTRYHTPLSIPIRAKLPWRYPYCSQLAPMCILQVSFSQIYPSFESSQLSPPSRRLNNVNYSILGCAGIVIMLSLHGVKADFKGDHAIMDDEW